MPLDLEREVKPRLRLGCPIAGVDISGRLVLEKAKYVSLEDELERTRKDLNTYRKYFAILLKTVESSIILHIIPQIFKHNVSQISEVKALYYFQRRNIVSFWVFLEEENWDAEDLIYEIYGMTLSMFPEYDIRLRLLRLWGRNPEDLLPAGGTKILGE